MNETPVQILEEGPQINTHVYEILYSLIQIGAEIVTFEWNGTEYVACIQKGRTLDVREYKHLRGPLADSIIHWFARAVDARLGIDPIVRHGNFSMKFAKAPWNMEVVFIPSFAKRASTLIRPAPIVAIIFSQPAEGTT